MTMKLLHMKIYKIDIKKQFFIYKCTVVLYTLIHSYQQQISTMWLLLKISTKIARFFFCDVFDEIYIRRHEEHSGGACIGVDENGDLQKGIVTFMIVGVTRNIPCVLSRLSSSWQIRTRDSILISSNSNVRFHCNNRLGNATVLTLCCMSFIVGFWDIA